MVYLADTNILVRYLDRSDPKYPLVRHAIRTLRANGHQTQASAQNFIEFWNVATRPIAHNGLGWTRPFALRMLRLLERVFPLLPDNADIYPEWRQLVTTVGVSGVQVHDARLAAVMLTHGVTHILTFNTADFARYAGLGIQAVDPLSVTVAP